MLNRVFSKREKILLVILALLLLGAAYYFLVQVPVSETVPQADAIVQEYDMQAKVLQVKYDKMLVMQAELDSMTEKDRNSTIPHYDNLPAIISHLNGILNKMPYKADFNDAVIGEDGIARRVVSLDFTAPSYDAATAAVAKLQDCDFLCRVDNVTIGPGRGADIRNKYSLASLKDVEVQATILYYETTK